MVTQPPKTINIFYCYALEDEELRSRLERQLSPLRRLQQITGWYNRDILAGTDWAREIETQLDTSSIILLLVSPDFMASDYCYSVEMQRALDRQHEEKAVVIPIILRPVQWEETPLGTLSALPVGGKPVTQWSNLDAALENVARGVSTIVKKLLAQQNLSENEANVVSSVPLLKKQTSSPSFPPSSQFVQSLARLGFNKKQFIERLSEAVRVTILGITHRRLAEYLREALAQKRFENGPEAFWLSIRIIFPSEAVLMLVDDELLTEFPNRHEATLKRIQVAGQAKRAISYLLIRENQPRRWSLYEYNFMIPFVGAIFEMADGTKVVQIATLRPNYTTSEHLFFEFSQDISVTAYYQAAFEEIIQHSTIQDEIVLIGAPQASEKQGFICKHARFRRSVLTPRLDSTDWLATILIILWHEESGRALPLLQIRTSENATRELDMLSNISGYINQSDCQEFDTGMKAEFLLQPSAYENAVLRELQEELGIKILARPRVELMRELRFYYPDRENLYFYVCRIRLDTPLYHIQQSAQLREWSFQEILKIRQYQVFTKVNDLLCLNWDNQTQLNIATQVLIDNLILHQQSDLAQKLARVAQMDVNERHQLQSELQELMNSCQTTYDLYGERRLILGLAGLQYREFFNSLVPIYAETGIEGAKEYLEWLRTYNPARIALNKLREHYGNRSAIREAVLDV